MFFYAMPRLRNGESCSSTLLSGLRQPAGERPRLYDLPHAAAAERSLLLPLRISGCGDGQHLPIVRGAVDRGSALLLKLRRADRYERRTTKHTAANAAHYSADYACCAASDRAAVIDTNQHRGCTFHFDSTRCCAA